MVLEQAQQSAPVAVEEPPVCQHHWVIEPANGRHSTGECRKCHEVRAFENSIYESQEAAESE